MNYDNGMNYLKVMNRFGVLVMALVMFAGCECCQECDEGAAAAGKPEWRTLYDGKTLDGWEATQFGPQGPVEIEDGVIVVNMGDGASGITYTKGDFPKVDYEVSLMAKRIAGNDFFCGMTFPVKDKFLTLVCGGWGGTVVGLSSIDSFDAANNMTARFMQFENDEWMEVRVRVTGETVDAWIGDDHVVDFEIEEHELSIRPEVELSRPFGLATWVTTAGYKDIKVRKLSKEEVMAAAPWKYGKGKKDE